MPCSYAHRAGALPGRKSPAAAGQGIHRGIPGRQISTSPNTPPPSLPTRRSFSRSSSEPVPRLRTPGLTAQIVQQRLAAPGTRHRERRHDLAASKRPKAVRSPPHHRQKLLHRLELRRRGRSPPQIPLRRCAPGPPRQHPNFPFRMVILFLFDSQVMIMASSLGCS